MPNRAMRVLSLFYSQATASKPRQVVFSFLLAGAVLNAILTYEDWAELPWWAAAGGFFMSLLGSLLFIGAVILVWDWVARRLEAATRF